MEVSCAKPNVHNFGNGIINNYPSKINAPFILIIVMIHIQRNERGNHSPEGYGKFISVQKIIQRSVRKVGDEPEQKSCSKQTYFFCFAFVNYFQPAGNH